MWTVLPCVLKGLLVFGGTGQPQSEEQLARYVVPTIAQQYLGLDHSTLSRYILSAAAVILVVLRIERILLYLNRRLGHTLPELPRILRKPMVIVFGPQRLTLAQLKSIWRIAPRTGAPCLVGVIWAYFLGLFGYHNALHRLQAAYCTKVSRDQCIY